MDPNKSISQYLHEEWSSEKGFIGGHVSAIAESKDGYLWIGTDRGLVRFNGIQFILMERPVPDMPPIGPVRGLIVDGAGALWIALDGRHLLRYRDGAFEDMLNLADPDITDVTTMALDRQGNLLVAVLAGSLFEFRDGSFNRVTCAERIPGIILAIAQSRDGSIWIGTRDAGLSRLAVGHMVRVAGVLGKTKINALLDAGDGGVWVGSDIGLFALDGGAQPRTNLPAALNRLDVLALTRDGDSNMWAATNRGLLRITRALQLSFKDLNAASDDSLTSVYLDRDGDIWYGGSDGIARLRDGMFTSWSTAEGLPSNKNGPLYVDPKGRTWFAPLAGGLYWLQDGQVHRVTNEGVNKDVVYSISGGQHEIWLGRQNGGITEITDNGSNFSSRSFSAAQGLPQKTVYSIYRNRDGTVWAATASEGFVFLKNGVVSRPPTSATSLASGAVNTIIEGNDGTMWFATSDGLVSYLRGQWKTRGVPDGLPSPYVQTIFEDSKQTLWIATSAGLAYLKSGQVRSLPHLPEDLREEIFGIAEDGLGNLWFETPDHVLQVNRDALASGSLSEADLQIYGETDGLPGSVGIRSDRSMVSDSLGRIWISLDRGIAEANPGFAVANATQSGVRIDSVSADGLELGAASLAGIAPGTRSVTFRFSSTNLSDPSRIRFRYKLDGSDRGWSEIVDLREVIYRNLGPGGYTFRIVGSNPEGIWSGPETAVAFVIDRAYWQTWWFRAACAAAFLALLWALYQFRVRQMQQEFNIALAARDEERTRIARELHDTLLQTLHGLMFRFQAARNMLPGRLQEAMGALDGAIERTAQAIAEGRNTIHQLRSSASADLDLADYLVATAQEFSFERAGYEVPEFRLVMEGEQQILTPSLREELHMICRELLRNAFQHAHARAIEAEIHYEEQEIRVRIRDDGKGFDPTKLEKNGHGRHWGLAGVRERAERIGAQVNIWSKSGAGTEVDLVVSVSRGPKKRHTGELVRFFRGARDDEHQD